MSRNDKKKDEGQQERVERQFLTFWLDEQHYGIPIEEVKRIVEMREIVGMPEFPSYAKGIISLKEDGVIPVIDVRTRFRKPERDYDERTCIIIVFIGKNKNNLIGFIVDKVNEVAKLFSDNITLPPRVASDYSNSFVSGIGQLEKGVVLLLDTNKIVNDDILEILTEAL